MKKLKLILFVFLCFFCNFVFVSAKRILTCEYDARIDDEKSSYVKIQAILYDDDRGFKMTYRSDDGNWNELDMSQPFYTVKDITQYAGNSPTDKIREEWNFNLNFELADDNSCPYVMTKVLPSEVIVEFTKTNEHCDNNYDGTYCTEVTVEKREDDAPSKPEVVNSCTVKPKTKETSSSTDIEVEFKNYTDGKIEFCLKSPNNDNEFKCTQAQTGDKFMELSVTDPKDNALDSYYIQLYEVPIILNPSEEYTSETCHIPLYLIHTDVKSKKWELTTSKKRFDEHFPPNMLHVPIIDGTNISNNITVGNCNAIVTGDFQKWLKELFYLIRIASIILVVVLTGMDGIRSFASFEDKNSKAFYNKLLIRLICLAIIFLVPSIIEVFLRIASANKNIANIIDNPFCGLFK